MWWPFLPLQPGPPASCGTAALPRQPSGQPALGGRSAAANLRSRRGHPRGRRCTGTGGAAAACGSGAALGAAWSAAAPHGRRRGGGRGAEGEAASREAPAPLRRGPRWLHGIRGDLRRRWTAQSYFRDWLDGLHPKSVATVAFMYFAVLAPVVAFGQLTAEVTGGILGVPHFIFSASLCGVVYGSLAGQPMTMIGPTGLTFAYVSALYRLCESNAWPFLGLYCWTGLWCSAVLVLLALGGACSLVRLVTRFTDDVFNGLIVLTFLATACQNIAAPFALVGADKTVPFIDASIALGTFAVALICGSARSLPYLWRGARGFLADFGPVLAISAAAAAARSPQVAALADISGLSVPATGGLGRPLLVNLQPGVGVPGWVPLAALPPALLLSLLFFLDQNITSRVVNNPANGLRKGATYHLDLLVLAGLLAVCSLMGLPWMVAATVQSLSHVRAMALGGEAAASGTSDQQTDGVIETRLTGVTVHALIGASFVILPLLRRVPASAISGLFLFLGVRMMRGNALLERLRLLFYDPASYPKEELQGVHPLTAHAFTMLQFGCLLLLWRLRAAPSTALLFPSVILLLVWVRLFLVPRAFRPEVVLALDEAIPEQLSKESS